MAYSPREYHSNDQQMVTTRVVMVQVGLVCRGGNSSGGDGILGSRDDSGNNGDGGGDGGVGAEAYSTMSALVDGDRGVWGRTDIRALWRRVMDTKTIV
ncbi:hypothetical protein Tco_1238829 [Tanacetum coccineum]